MYALAVVSLSVIGDIDKGSMDQNFEQARNSMFDSYSNDGNDLNALEEV